ncbi:MAG: glycine--tRNA ligase subunit beta [Betaproteobacteria bacterium]|nr:glycine--tRNA ligase subunit beta [Betaproteobacteria bacterium]
MSTASLLVELFTEELPPKSLPKLASAFGNTLKAELSKSDLLERDSELLVFATPRRLSARLTKVRPKAPDSRTQKKLMLAAIAFNSDGQPTDALKKKLTALGYDSFVEGPSANFVRQMEGGKEVLYLDQDEMGMPLAFELDLAIKKTIADLPVAKLMTYQLADGITDVKFVRPVHGLVALHGAEVLNVDALGLQAGRITHGHRFQGATNVELANADEYEAKLEKEGGVIASFDKRKAEIHRLLRERAEEAGDTLGEPEDYAALLDEVTALVEMPTVYMGQFEQEFLAVPAECLILTMKLNQKYFPLFLSEGGLSSRFLIVSNMRLDDPRNVIEGNERVVRPRLSDARFFFETDKKTKLADRIPKLASVVYHNKLGSQGERVERVRKLAVSIANAIGADAKLADRAALLAKADLVTDMVGEFPELQGTMGRYYALHDGESPLVADAIAQHYQPRFSGDALPDSTVAISVALADKMETLAGLFSIGQIPTGDKDPFALRRHALGVLRMLIERNLPLSVSELVASALSSFPNALPDAAAQLTNYIFDRLSGYLRDLGYTALEVDAAVSARPPWGEFPARLSAIRQFTQLPEAASLAAANKRIGNILKKSEQGGDAVKVDTGLLQEAAERGLFDVIAAARPVFDQHFAAHDYTAALKSLASLKTPVDAFFDGVMVNAEDAKLRANRLALLADLHALMNRVADLSKLAT